MLQQLRQRLAAPLPTWELKQPPGAAVLVAFTDHAPDPDVILIRRAEHLASHGGEVAFPGGKREPEDPDLRTTALREAQEEVALLPSQVEILAELGPRQTRFGLGVVPYVGIVPHDVSLTACPEELESIFRVPVRWLLDDPRATTDRFHRWGQHFEIPRYHWGDYVIWGFTAALLVDVLNLGFAAGIEARTVAQYRAHQQREAG